MQDQNKPKEELQRRAIRTAASKNINNFIRVQIHLQDGTGFPLTLDINQSMTSVAKLIEAEATFRNIQRVDQENPLQDLSKAIACYQLYDAANIAIPFSAKVREVLKFDDEIFPVTSLEDPVPLSMKFIKTSGSAFNLAEALIDKESTETPDPYANQILQGDHFPPEKSNEHQLSSFSETKELRNDDKIAKLSRKLVSATSIASTADDRLDSILHNLSALHFFNEFCLNQYSIENVLFWIEAEVYQTIHDEPDRQAFAHHVYHVYIKEGSPLELNLDGDIRLLATAKYEKNEENMFADLQEFIFLLMKQFAYTRFEDSPIFQKFLEFKTNDRYAYVQGKIVWDYSTLKKNFKKISLDSKDVSAPLFRQRVLLDILERYFAESILVSNKYFDFEDRSEKRQKSKLIRKQKRLAKFFGYRLSEQQLRYQNDDMVQNLFATEDDLIAPRESLREESKDQKRKKAEKLVEFFGDILPNKELRRQSLLPGKASDDNLPVPQDVDVAIKLKKLSKEERIYLQKRAKKLLTILGSDFEGKPLSHGQVVNQIYNNPIPSHIIAEDIEIDISSNESSMKELENNNEETTQSGTKRKKMEKLIDFFGNQLSHDEMKKQSLIKSLSSGENEPEDPSSDTKSDLIGNLSPEEKLILQKRAKKLLSILGDELDGKPIFTSDIVRENQAKVVVRNVAPDDSILADDVDEIEEDKEPSYHTNRAKLDKLKKVMGGNINESHLKDTVMDGQNFARPLSTSEKRKFKKKNDKLERVFGNVVPAEELIHYSDPSGRVDDSDNDSDSSEPSSLCNKVTDNIDVEKQNQMARLRKLKKMLGITEGAVVIEDALNQIHEAVNKIVENEEERKSFIEELQQITLTPSEKKILQKKNQKLEQVFGYTVPANIISSTSHSVHIENQVIQTELSIGSPVIQMDEGRRMRLARLRKLRKMLGINDESGPITEDAIRAIQDAIKSSSDNEIEQISLLEELEKSRSLL